MNVVSGTYAKCMIFLVAGVLSVCNLSAAPVLSCVRQLTVDDGLSQNMVYCILQDSRGYMWFGTQDGLNRFDGHRFRVYKNGCEENREVGARGFFSAVETDDGMIWFATTDGVKIYDPDLDEFQSFDAKSADGYMVTGNVRSIRKALDGSIWMCCQDGHLFCWNDGKGLVLYDLKDILPHPNLRDVVVCEDGDVYVATYGYGIVRLNPFTSEVRAFDFTDRYANDVNVVYPYGKDCILVGTSSDGVLEFDRRSGDFRSLPVKDSRGRKLFVRSLMCCSDRMVWIGTESGLYIYDGRTSETVMMEYSASDPYSLSDNAVYAICEDSDEGIWIGTYFGGVNYITKSALFEKYYPIPGKNSIGGRCVSEFAESEDGRIWVGTEDAGLFVFHPSDRNFSKVPIDAQNIHSLLYDDGRLWVGTFTKGLYLLDSSDGRVIKRWTVGDGKIGSDNVYSIFKDSYGRIWVGAMPGLHYYDRKLGKFVRVQEELLTGQVNDIIEDAKGLLWFATYGNGLWMHDPARDLWKHYPHVDDSGTMNDVGCLVEDYEGRIWTGTNGGGLFVYDMENDVFRVRFDSSSGLLNDVVYSLKCDRAGNVWGSTNKGLFRVDIRTMTVSTYTHESGLLCDQFNYKSGFASKDGTMFFGGIKGFVSFEPEKMITRKERPEPFISNLEMNGNEVRLTADELVIPHDVSTFSIGLNEINFAPSHNNIYYMLEGWDKVWLTVEVPSKVTYSNVPVGSYRFRVRYSPEGEEDLISLNVVVEPSVWTTWWAKLIYLLVLLSMALLSAFFVFRRVEQNKKERERTLLEDKEREIFKAKLEFFSNITHEIRTPLSLIRLPLEEIISDTSHSDKRYKTMLIIRDNVDRLLNLVNQLLDFRKISDIKDVLFVHSDAVPLVAKTIARFQPSADVKNIAIEAELPDSLYVDVDAEMLTKMASNLFTNALKHARSRVLVRMYEEDGWFRLAVANDGDLIPRELSEKIFSPYYKLDESTEGFGIGLPFVRSLTEIHGGSISLVPRTDMTEFRISLPLEQDNVIRMSSSDVRDSVDRDENDTIPETIHKKTVLLVDDDASFADFLSNHLAFKYKMKKAYSVESAMEHIRTKHIDIIISDVKLPDVSGLELCRKMKADRRYANIPMILLTGETSRESKLKGIEAGADAYLEKPCYLDFLISCIENLLKGRYVVDTTESVDARPASDIVYTKADENILNRLTELIYSHIEEVDLDVNRLAAMMNMSRATLYRKVKDSLKVTPNDLIRIIRLEKAAELLRQNEYRINEIAYIVGFSSSSYFSKCFRKQYGVLPKDFS